MPLSFASFSLHHAPHVSFYTEVIQITKTLLTEAVTDSTLLTEVRCLCVHFLSVHNLQCRGNRPMRYLVSVVTWGFLKGNASYLCFGIEFLFYVHTDYMPSVTVILWFHSLLLKWVDANRTTRGYPICSKPPPTKIPGRGEKGASSNKL